jgi:two-component system response regulator MprA
MRVLVLDDDRAFLEMLSSALVEEGHRVVATTDGRTGLDLAHRSPPDVIVLDVLMPGMDGATFADIYARQPGPHAPIVVVTGAPPPLTPRVEHAAAYLTKPFELDDLMGVLREVSAQN